MPQGGPARKGEVKSANLNKKRRHQARLDRPKSHYSGMRRNAKAKIRPFVFMELPGEIRNMIYDLLLHPKVDKFKTKVDKLGDRVPTRATREDTKLRGYSYPEMKVLRLSKAIYEEASSFFYARHHLEMSVRMDRKKIAPQLPDNLPFERFTDLRMLFIHYGCCYLQCIGSDLDVDFSGLLASLPALRTVHISVRDYTFIDQYASAYPESPALDELVKQIKVSVPASVGIKWEYWKGESPVGHDAEDCINGIPTQSTDLDVLPAVAARV